MQSVMMVSMGVCVWMSRELRPWMWGQLIGTVITHILLMLFTHWSARVKVAVLYLPAKNVGLARAVLVRLSCSGSCTLVGL